MSGKVYGILAFLMGFGVGIATAKATFFSLPMALLAGIWIDRYGRRLFAGE